MPRQFSILVVDERGCLGCKMKPLAVDSLCRLGLVGSSRADSLSQVSAWGPCVTYVYKIQADRTNAVVKRTGDLVPSVMLTLVWTYICMCVCVDVCRYTCVCLYLYVWRYIDTKPFRVVFVRVFLGTGFCILRLWPVREVHKQSQPKGDSEVGDFLLQFLWLVCYTLCPFSEGDKRGCLIGWSRESDSDVSLSRKDWVEVPLNWKAESRS